MRGALAPERRAGTWLLAATIFLLEVIGPITGGFNRTNSPVVGPLSLALALGQGLPLVWRRDHPQVVAAAVLSCYAAYGQLLGLEPPYAAWVAIWTIAVQASNQRRATYQIAAAALVTVVSVFGAEVRWEGSGASGLLVATTVVVALGGVIVCSERSRVAAVHQAATTTERVRIARDLHDSVGHGLSAVAVQSSTARMALEQGDESTARLALAAIEASSRAAMHEMRLLLGVLKDTAAPVDGGAVGSGGSNAVEADVDIPALVERTHASGVTVALETTGDLGDFPHQVRVCSYRVVQEALTNAVKHAPGCSVAVRVDGLRDCVRVTVQTVGGVYAGQVNSGGLGLDGVRGRVAELGGRTSIGPVGGGWLVEAELPRSVSDRR